MTWVLTLVALAVVIGIVPVRPHACARAAGRSRSDWCSAGRWATSSTASSAARARCEGHVVDFVSVGWLPVFNVADSAITSAASLLVRLALLGRDRRRRLVDQGRGDGMSLRTLPVPDGLDGMRLDAGLSRMLGLSRTVVAELASDGAVRLDGARRGQVGPSDRGRLARGRAPGAGAGRRSSSPPQAVEGLVVLHEDEEIVVVDKPVGVAVHPSPGWSGRPSSRGSPRSASRSPPAARPSARASSTGSTPARPGSWSSRSPSAPTRCSSTPSASGRSPRSTSRSSRVTPTPATAPSTRRSTATPSTTGASR